MPETRHTLSHGEAVAPHSHEQGQLLYATSGVLATTTELGTWVSPADRISWTPPQFEHWHRAHGRTEVSILEVPQELSDVLPKHPSVFAVSGLLREVVLRLTGDHMLRPGVERRLLRVAVDELLDLPTRAVYLPEATDERLRAVTDWLHGDPADPYTLAELGQAVGASERTLSRLFRTELGMTFHQWRTLLRVQQALVYLAEGRSVTGTAVLCGWANPTSFIEAFTAIVGETPGRYQSSLREPGVREPGVRVPRRSDTGF